MARACVYCGDPVGDPEHAWPKWLQRWINPDAGEVRIQHGTGGPVRGGRGWNTTIVKRLCTPCNRWSGTRFEDTTAPVFKLLDSGTLMTVGVPQQLTLARWVYKTMLMLECAGVGGPPVAPAEFQRFRRAAKPPANCSIAIGVSAHRALAFHRELMPNRDPNGEEIPGGYTAVVVASHILFHIIGDTAATRVHERRAPALASLLMPIWPRSDAEFNWPPAYIWDKRSVTELANWSGGLFEFI